jgi:reactive chlorine resistance protein C
MQLTSNIGAARQPALDYWQRLDPSRWIEPAGRIALRYGLVLILLWIGAMKFTAYEAEGIRPFVSNSPLFSWTYPLLGQQGLSNLLGVIEVVIALLIASRPWLPRVSAIASLLAAGMFLSTLSFLVTTPEAWVPGSGFPALGVPGQFLLKDIVLLGASLWAASEAWLASNGK